MFDNINVTRYVLISDLNYRGIEHGEALQYLMCKTIQTCPLFEN